MLVAVLGPSNTKIEIDSFKEITEDSETIFLLTSTIFPALNIKVRYNLPVHRDYQVKDFDCYPFFSDAYFKESDIYEIHEQSISSRIGWIFPVQALASKEHVEAENKHFLKYAFVTFKHLLTGKFFKKDFEFNVDSLDEEVEISDIYPSSLIVCSLSKQKTNLIADFDIKNFIPSFFINRYYWCDDVFRLKNVNQINITKTGQKVWVKTTSKWLKDDLFIQALFNKYLIESTHPLVHFHLLYQIIEIIIERILDIEIKILVESFEEKKKSSYDLKKEMQDVNAEEKRVSKLFTSYLTSPVNSKSFIDCCNWMLSQIDKEAQDIVTALYQTRNKIVHKFREVVNIDTSDFNNLKLINEEFELILVHVVCCYQEPVPKNRKTVLRQYRNLRAINRKLKKR